MKKRILSWLLILCISMSTICIMPYTASAATSGTCGDNLTWTLSDDGTLTISGYGNMDNWTILSDNPWYTQYRYAVKSIVIADGVTSIGDRAFGYFFNLSNVTLSSSIEKIGESAFYNCRAISKISLPSGVKIIGKGAFHNCISLTNISLPNTITEIGGQAFQECSFSEITIPYGVKTIGNSAFANCENLTIISIPETVEVIESGNFSICPKLVNINVNSNNATYASCDGVLFDKEKHTLFRCPEGKKGEYTIPNTVTKLGEYAFYYCVNLSEISIPNSVTTIGSSCFFNCDGITNIIIPKKVSYIGYYTFRDCNNLINVTIPNSISRIDNYAFDFSESIQNVYYCGTQSEWESVSIGYNNVYLTGANIYFLSNYNVNYNYSYNGGTSATSTVDKVADGLIADLTPTATKPGWIFVGWNTNPSATTALSSYTVTKNTTLYAIYKKTLTAKFYSASNSLQSTKTITLYNNATSESITAPTPSSYSGWTISGWRDDTTAGSYEYSKTASISISDDKSFYATYYRTITLSYNANGGTSTPNNQTATQYYNACGNKQGKSFTLANAIQHSDANFKGWSPNNDSSTLYNANAVITIVTDTVMNAEWTPYGVCGDDLKWSLDNDGNLSITGTGDMYDWTSNSSVPWYEYRNEIKKVTLDNSVTSIGKRAFYNCSNLEQITLSDELITINDYAFYGSSKLSNVTLPEFVSVIGNNAFYNCGSLTEIEIPKNTVSLGNYAFRNCGALAKIIFLGNTTISNGVLSGCASNLVIHGYTGSNAETYANTNSIPFVTLGNPDISYTISYNPNGGVNAPASQIKKYGVTLTLTSDIPERSGYTFDGWASTSTSTEVTYRPGDVYTSEASITLYAVWRKNDSNIPTVSIGGSDNITTTSARLIGKVDDDGGEPVINRHIVYFEKNNPNARYTVVANSNFEATVVNLKESTEYWFYATANNSRGYGNSAVGKFTTLSGANVQPSEFSITNQNISVKKGATTALSYKILPTSASNKNIIWSSSDEKIATVSNDGVIKGISEGTATITGTTEIGRLSQSCVVNVKENVVTDIIDLSEWNMVTNTSNKTNKGWNLSTSALDKQGGNIQRAISYLTRWDGPVYETDDTYPVGTTDGELKELGNPLYHIQDIVFIPTRKDSLDNDAIKNAIVKYGAVHTSYKTQANLYNSKQSTFYNSTTSGSGHAVAIIGWDDEYSAENFVKTPPGNGAFICKNSYGSEMGDNGYLYISYYDANLGIKAFSAAYSGIEGSDNYSKIYQYDPLGPTTAASFGEGEKLFCANVFPAESDGGVATDEQLAAVSFYTVDPGTHCRIFIIPDYTEASDLKNVGEPIIDTIVQDAGYHTIKFDTEICISKGNRFAVIVQVINSTTTPKQYIEKPFSHYTNANGNANESFYSKDGILWIDLADTDSYKSSNICIKAFTNTSSVSTASVNAIDNENRIYADQVVYSVDEVLASGDVLSEEFVNTVQSISLMSIDSDDEDTETIEEDIPPSIDVGSDIDYLDGGSLPTKYDLRNSNEITTVKNQGAFFNCWAFANIAALESSILKKLNTNTDGSLDGSIETNDAITKINFVTTSITIAQGSEQQLQIITEPLNVTTPITYTSSSEGIVSVNTGGRIKGISNGIATITASCGNLSTECTITVTSGSSVSSIELSDEKIVADKGRDILIDYNIYPMDALNKNVKWQSDNTDVCTVNENGVISLNSEGTATITVQTLDGSKTDTCEITVRNSNIPCSISITGNTLQKYREYLFGQIDYKINNFEEKTVGVLYCAIYDNAGKLISLQCQDMNLSYGEYTDKFTFDLENIEALSGEVKVFMWNGKTIEPLALVAKSTWQ